MRVYILPANHVQEPVVRDGHGTYICVFLSNQKTEQVQNLRCVSCGWVVAQYTNSAVESIVYGSSVPKEQNSLDVYCSRCKLTYRIV